MSIVFLLSSRVWRYRGGRDGHETLQQFMCFLGRGLEEGVEQETVKNGGEGEIGRQRRRKKVYAGVVAFCLPTALESGGERVSPGEYQV